MLATYDIVLRYIAEVNRNHSGMVMMEQQAQPIQAPPIYVTANTLVGNNVTLEAALRIARVAGADGFELRRELLPPTMQLDEIRSLRTLLEAFPSPPAYSIPRPLFTAERFEQTPLLEALSEAHSFGCHLVKFSPGSMEPAEASLVALRALLSAWKGEMPGLMVTVENDQSAASSDLAKWARFFEQAASLDCPIGMTFDLGNWTCVGIDTVEAAQTLGCYVVYVHAKSVERKNGQCISQPIRAASAHHPALASLAADAPRAIEFPITAANDDILISTLRTYTARLRSGNFAT